MKINFNWFDKEPKNMDIHLDHVIKQIKDGYIEGELCHEEENENGETERLEGWWSIEKDNCTVCKNNIEQKNKAIIRKKEKIINLLK